jgi:hypothetical protein
LKNETNCNILFKSESAIDQKGNKMKPCKMALKQAQLYHSAMKARCTRLMAKAEGILEAAQIEAGLLDDPKLYKAGKQSARDARCQKEAEAIARGVDIVNTPEELW